VCVWECVCVRVCVCLYIKVEGREKKSAMYTCMHCILVWIHTYIHTCINTEIHTYIMWESPVALRCKVGFEMFFLASMLKLLRHIMLKCVESRWPVTVSTVVFLYQLSLFECQIVVKYHCWVSKVDLRCRAGFEMCFSSVNARALVSHHDDGRFYFHS